MPPHRRNINDPQRERFQLNATTLQSRAARGGAGIRYLLRGASVTGLLIKAPKGRLFRRDIAAPQPTGSTTSFVLDTTERETN